MKEFPKLYLSSSQAKLRYDPVELDPEDMCRLASEQPQVNLIPEWFSPQNWFYGVSFCDLKL